MLTQLIGSTAAQLSLEVALALSTFAEFPRLLRTLGSFLTVFFRGCAVPAYIRQSSDTPATVSAR